MTRPDTSFKVRMDDPLKERVAQAARANNRITAATKPDSPEMAAANAEAIKLQGARERLCVAQQWAPAHWKSDLQIAIDIIDQYGSTLPGWSKYCQPETKEDSR